MDISIYTLTSTLHDKEAIAISTKEFLEGLKLSYDFADSDYSDYGTHALNLIYVRTGGTEAQFKELLPQLRAKSNAPVYLLTSGKSNSLAASLEILAYLRQNNICGEIIHGTNVYIRHRIKVLLNVSKARKRLEGSRLAVIGKPSDWLISSHADYAMVKEKLGIEIIDIPMQELLDIYETQTEDTDEELLEKAPNDAVAKSIPGALRIYNSLKVLVEKYQLNGFTIRCFDLLSAVHNTGCVALAKLNSEGIVAGCEGDVPAMLSMMVSLSLTGVTGFQANPASINPSTGELVFAHCTIPFNMVDRYELDTHFESGIGVGIRGFMHGFITIFKMSGDVSRIFAEEGTVEKCGCKENMCRTQQIIVMNNSERIRYFLTDPIGNHHIIIPGHHKEELEELLECKQCKM